MFIQRLGHSCFKIQTKINQENINLITDPFDDSIGLKMPKTEADIVTISHDHSDHNNVQNILNNPFIIKSSGEYEVKGILVQGIDSFHDEEQGQEKGKNIIYRIEVDGVSIVHLGDLGHILNEDQLKDLLGADILLIPVGGKYTLDAKKASQVVNQLEPRIVIPMHYKTEKINLDIDEVDNFIKEIGLEPQRENKLKIDKKDLPQETMELIILE